MPVYGEVSADYNTENPQAYLAGAGGVNAMMQNFAQQAAGRQLATGDTTGAQQTLDNQGMTDAAEKIQTDANTQTTFQNTQADRVTAQQQAATEHDGQFLLDVANTLEMVRQQKGDTGVLPAFDQLTPVFRARGGTDQQIAMIRAQVAADPENFIAAAAAHGSKILEPFTLDAGQVHYGPDGKIIAAAPSDHVLAQGQDLVRTDPGVGGTSAGYAAGSAPSSAQGAPAAAPAAGPTAAPTPGGSSQAYLTAVNGREGTARNPYSSANGFGQFLGLLDHNGVGHGTWFDVVKGDPQFADAIKGKTDAQILAMRQDKTKDSNGLTMAQEATLSYGRTNASYLSSHGLAPTMANIGMAHGFGGGGAVEVLRAANQNPDTPMNQVVPAAVIRANPGLAHMTAGQVVQAFEHRFGNSAGGAGGAPAASETPQTSVGSGATVIASVPPAEAADTKGAFSLSPGQTRYGADGKPIVSAPAKPGEAGKLPAQDAKRMEGIDAVASQARIVANMAKDFVSRAQGVGTGWQYNAFGGSHTATGISGGVRPGQVFNAIMDPDTLAKVQELDAITNRAAPMLRPAGTGRILGPEYGNFLRAFPSTKNAPEANSAIANTLEQEATQAEALQRQAHSYASGHGHLDGFDEFRQTGVDSNPSAVPTASGPKVRHWDPKRGLID